MEAPSPERADPETTRRASDEMLAPIARKFAWHARTVDVNDELERRLRSLDPSAWHCVRGLPVCGKCLPVTLLGPRGVFVLAATRGQWQMSDIDYMQTAACAVGHVMPAYESPVRAALVIMGGEQTPREWVRGAAAACWLLGEGWLVTWLHHFKDDGLSRADIAQLRNLADPRALRDVSRALIPVGSG